MKTLLLIDASALIYRFFHALPPLTTPQKEPIQGIYGLTNVILKILREQNPNYAAAALDRPERTLRKEKFEQYKIQRPPVPNELIFQLKMLPRVFAAFGIKTFEKPGYEADDIIGTLGEKFKNEPDLKILILSGDLDVLQLVENDKIIGQIIKTGLSNTELYNEFKVEERYGLKPGQLPDYKALVGDSSDNIPGIKGIGPKTAAELLKEFSTLEGIFENISIISGTVSKKLESKSEAAFLYRELATIDKNAPVEIPDILDLQVHTDPEKVKAFCAALGFTSLTSKI